MICPARRFISYFPCYKQEGEPGYSHHSRLIPRLTACRVSNAVDYITRSQKGALYHIVVSDNQYIAFDSRPKIFRKGLTGDVGMCIITWYEETNSKYKRRTSHTVQGNCHVGTKRHDGNHLGPCAGVRCQSTKETEEITAEAGLPAAATAGKPYPAHGE